MIETNIPPHPALQYQGAHCLSFTSNKREELAQAAYFPVRRTLVSEQTCVPFCSRTDKRKRLNIMCNILQ